MENNNNPHSTTVTKKQLIKSIRIMMQLLMLLHYDNTRLIYENYVPDLSSTVLLFLTRPLRSSEIMTSEDGTIVCTYLIASHRRHDLPRQAFPLYPHLSCTSSDLI